MDAEVRKNKLKVDNIHVKINRDRDKFIVYVDDKAYESFTALSEVVRFVLHSKGINLWHGLNSQ